MPWEGWVTIVVVTLFIVGLARNWTAPDLLSIACLSLLVAIGSVTGSDRFPSAGEALAGMGFLANYGGSMVCRGGRADSNRRHGVDRATVVGGPHGCGRVEVAPARDDAKRVL